MPNLSLNQMVDEGRSFSGHEKNCVYLNTRDGQFANVSAVSGFDFPEDGRALVTIDWDRDGDLDLFLTNRNAPRLRMLRNDLPRTNHFLTLRLIGNGKDTNRDAIGARVRVVCNANSTSDEKSVLIKTLAAGDGFLSQSSRELHFGLGNATSIREVMVQWPTASREERVERFKSLHLDRRYEIVQGTGRAQPFDDEAARQRRDPVDQLRSGELLLPPPTAQGTARMGIPIPMPELHYLNFNSQTQTTQFADGEHTLINLWATSCGPCLKELREFTRNAELLSGNNVRVLALCVDPLQDRQFASSSAADMLRKMSFPFDSGLATPAAVELLQKVHDDQVNAHRPLPIPASFLVNSAGDLIAIYKGPVSPDEVVRDVTEATTGDDHWRTWAALFPGQYLKTEPLDRVWQTRQGSIAVHAAYQLSQWGRHEEAQQQLRRVIERYPESAAAVTNLATVLMRLNRTDEAEQAYQRALEIDPDLVQALNGLAAVHAGRGELEEAADLLRRAREIDPLYAIARDNLRAIEAKLRRRSGGARPVATP